MLQTDPDGFGHYVAGDGTFGLWEEVCHVGIFTICGPIF